MAPSDPPRRRRYLLAALAILGACAASFALGVRHGAHPEDALGVREMVGAATRGPPAACPAPKPCPPALEAGGRAEPRVVDPPACPACDPCSPAPRAATPRAPEPRLAAGGPPPGRGGKDEAGDEGGEAAGAGESTDEGKRAVDASMGPEDDRKASPAASNGTAADEPTTPRASADGECPACAACPTCEKGECPDAPTCGDGDGDGAGTSRECPPCDPCPVCVSSSPCETYPPCDAR